MPEQFHITLSMVGKTTLESSLNDSFHSAKFLHGVHRLL